MKLLILGVLLSFNLSATARAVSADPNECADCGVKFRGSAMGSSDVGQLRKIASLAGGVSQNISELSNRICSIYGFNGNKIATDVKKAIVNHMAQYEGISNPTPAQMLKFLNRNKNHMTCGEDNKNYMMVSFEHGMAYDKLFNELFFDELYLEDESVKIDVNAVSFTGPGGAPETVLDYMYKQLTLSQSEAYKKEVRELIDLFEGELGARRYSQL